MRPSPPDPPERRPAVAWGDIEPVAWVALIGWTLFQFALPADPVTVALRVGAAFVVVYAAVRIIAPRRG